MASVREFTRGDGYEIKAPHMPVHVLMRGEKWIGVFQRMPMVVCSPHWPKDVSARDVLEGGNLMVESARFCDGACVVETDPEGNFTEEVMAHLGLVPRGTKLFQKT